MLPAHLSNRDAWACALHLSGGFLVLAFAVFALRFELWTFHEPEELSRIYGLHELRDSVMYCGLFTAHYAFLVSRLATWALALRGAACSRTSGTMHLAYGAAMLTITLSPIGTKMASHLYNTDKTWIFSDGLMLGVFPGGGVWFYALTVLVGGVMLWLPRNTSLSAVGRFVDEPQRGGLAVNSRFGAHGEIHPRSDFTVSDLDYG